MLYDPLKDKKKDEMDQQPRNYRAARIGKGYKNIFRPSNEIFHLFSLINVTHSKADFPEAVKQLFYDHFLSLRLLKNFSISTAINTVADNPITSRSSFRLRGCVLKIGLKRGI